MACRRSEFLKIGAFDVSFRIASEDREFCDRWRMAGRRLSWIQDAVIEHRHAQSFLGFTRLHFRYGQGACLYKKIRCQRESGTMSGDVAFHREVPQMAWNFRDRFSIARFLLFSALLLWWEFINAVGFALAGFKNRHQE